MEPLNPTQLPTIGPIPRKRKAGGEFLTALNLLADTYSQSGNPHKHAVERAQRGIAAQANPSTPEEN